MLRAVASQIKQGVVARLCAQQQGAAGPAALQLLRGFADASYLDKGEVTDRVLGVVKNFEKVDAAQVRGAWAWRARSGGGSVGGARLGFPRARAAAAAGGRAGGPAA